MPVIPFYGSQDPELFRIERRAMDRSGRVIRVLGDLLPESGSVLDVGAGCGFTADRLTTVNRQVVAMEPAAGMIDRSRGLPWVRGDAARLPFAAGAFAGAYATWAYFFPSLHSIEGAVDELERVVTPSGVIALVNNLGDDEFSALSDRDIAEPTGPFEALGFELKVVETAFEFDDLQEARALLGAFFGDRGRDGARLRVGYRVGIFLKRLPV